MSTLINLKTFMKRFFCTEIVKNNSIFTRNMSQNIIAVCQMTATNDKDRNFDVFKKLVVEAKKAKAKIAFFPEACDFVGSSKEETFHLAEPLDGPLVKKYKELAQVFISYLFYLMLVLYKKSYWNFFSRVKRYGCH